MVATSLQISEIYPSIQGESLLAGLPTVFVRTVGCPVRCVYCDSAYAFHGGERRSLQEVVDAVAAFGIRRVCVTGGEPLAQAATFELIGEFVRAGYEVSVETSGVRSIAGLCRPAKVVLDLKTPGSSVAEAWLPENLDLLVSGDELKVVVTSRADWEWLLDWLPRNRGRIAPGVAVSVSPVAPDVAPAALVEWLLASGLDLRLNLQLHKFVWPGETRGR